MNPRKAIAPLTAGALLVLMGLLAGGAAMRESVTYDEGLNVGAGVSYWQKLGLRLSEEHPPLPRVIAAFPLLLHGVRADYSNIAWTVSDPLFPAYAGQLYFGELLLHHWNDPRSTLALARLPMLLLAWPYSSAAWCTFTRGRSAGARVALSARQSTPPRIP